MILQPLSEVFGEARVNLSWVTLATKKIDVIHDLLGSQRACHSKPGEKRYGPSFALRATEGILRLLRSAKNGGEGGIRTHGDLSATPVFKTGAINHSTTSPDVLVTRR